MDPRTAAGILRRIQEPEAYEPKITQKAFDALELAIKTLEREAEDQAGSGRQKDGNQFILREDGTAEAYDDTYDITIHCTSEDEQREILKKIESAFKRKETEIIYCKYCTRRRKNAETGEYYCRASGFRNTDYDFCSGGKRAERRTDD